MWILTVRSPNGEPKQYYMHPGNNTLGRMSGNDIVILDTSASRYHAKIVFDETKDTVTLTDLGSTNGTFINREKISTSHNVRPNDVIRIGHYMIDVAFWDGHSQPSIGELPKTAMLTRELLLESLDQHAVLLTEIAARLNTVVDLDTALREVSNMMKTSMGADRCEVIMANQFDKLTDLGFATSIAQQALDQRSAVIINDIADPALGKSATLLRIRAALCVPVISGNQTLALIYVIKNRPQTRRFNQRDLQLAVAIGHQASLVIQRMELLERIRHEELLSKLLQRFLSPQEASFVLKEYQEHGRLPPLAEHNLTILAADICGSTQLAERLGAPRFSRVLNSYYQQMTEVVFKHSGILHKFLGDGLMAVFGMRREVANPEEKAVVTALDMLDELKNIHLDFGEQIQIGIGINSGPAVAGYIGTQEYLELAVLGYPVNIAWGLEALARPNRIFIGHPTYQAVSNTFTIHPIGNIEIKKHLDPINAYEVIP